VTAEAVGHMTQDYAYN